MTKAIKEFEVRWHNGNFTGWEGHKPITSDDIAPIDLAPYTSAVELEQVALGSAIAPPPPLPVEAALTPGIPCFFCARGAVGDSLGRSV
jgi:hypothetical protein